MQESDSKMNEKGLSDSAKPQNSRRKVENIEEIKDSEKTQLHRPYTIWALMK